MYQPYKPQQRNAGIWGYKVQADAMKCIHGGYPEDCRTCERLTFENERRNTLNMEKIDLLEALIVRLRKAAMTTKDRHARDRIIRKAHEFLSEQQDLIRQSIVT